MTENVYVDREGCEWVIQTKVSNRMGVVKFSYRLSKIGCVLQTKWFTNEQMWAFIIKEKWCLKNV